MCSSIILPRLVFTHMPTVPVLVVGKEGRTIIGPWGSADHEQDWQPYPVDAQSAESDDHTHIHGIFALLIFYTKYNDILYYDAIISY